MAIECGYMNLIIPIEKIEKHYPGGFKQYKIDNEKSITEYEPLPVELGDTLMTHIINFLSQGVIPSDQNMARKLVRQVA